MNKEQKSAAVEKIVGRVKDSDAIFAVDYRGITVSQTAELRNKLRESDATFQIVKNTLTRRALDEVGDDTIKPFLEGPTALTYVRGDAASVAKTLNNFAKETELLVFKGGQMGAHVVGVDEFKTLASLPARDVLLQRFVGMVASPLTGLVTSLNGLIQGLATQLGQIAEQGLVGGNAPAVEAPPAEASPPEAEAAPVEAAPAEEAPAAEATAEEAPAEQAPAAEAPVAEDTAPAGELAAEAQAEDATAAAGAPADAVADAETDEPTPEEPAEQPSKAEGDDGEAPDEGPAADES